MEKTSPIIHFETLGCKVNQIESESAARSFFDGGFECTMGGITSASKTNKSTILSILNTCTVTAKAEQKARRLIRLLLEKHPNSCVIVTGCYAELEKALLENIDKRICVLKGTQKDMLVELPKEINAFLLSHAESLISPIELSKYCSKYFNKTSEKLSLSKQKRTFLLSTDTFLQHSRSSIKIQDGCNYRCTYCRICLARGESFSLSPDEVLKRIISLEKANHVEVIITGINLAQYKSNGMDFSTLLAFLLKNTSTIHFRISSLHPQIVTEELCNVLSHKRVRPHFHLSIQSGSDAILKKMARPNNAEHIKNAIERLRAVKPNAFMACDIIVGFPGETEEDFNLTKNICQDGCLTWIHAFPFSPRPGTLAFDMKPRVQQNVSNERVRVLTDIAINQKKDYIYSCIGKTYKGVVEKYRRNNIQVVTENFLHVKIDPKTISESPLSLGGKEVLLKILGSDKDDLRQADGEAFGIIEKIL